MYSSKHQTLELTWSLSEEEIVGKQLHLNLCLFPGKYPQIVADAVIIPNLAPEDGRMFYSLIPALDQQHKTIGIDISDIDGVDFKSSYLEFGEEMFSLESSFCPTISSSVNGVELLTPTFKYCFKWVGIEPDTDYSESLISTSRPPLPNHGNPKVRGGCCGKQRSYTLGEKSSQSSHRGSIRHDSSSSGVNRSGGGGGGGDGGEGRKPEKGNQQKLPDDKIVIPVIKDNTEKSLVELLELLKNALPEVQARIASVLHERYQGRTPWWSSLAATVLDYTLVLDNYDSIKEVDFRTLLSRLAGIYTEVQINVFITLLGQYDKSKRVFISVLNEILNPDSKETKQGADTRKKDEQAEEVALLMEIDGELNTYNRARLEFKTRSEQRARK